MITDRKAADILSIKDDRPEDLFSSPVSVKDEYRALAKKWHPDAGGDAEVLVKINVLYKLAQGRIANGSWNKIDTEFLTWNGRQSRFSYWSRRRIGVGYLLYGATHIMVIFEAPHALLVDAAISAIKALKFDSEPQKKMQMCMPDVVETGDLGDGRRAILFRKTPDVFLLRDVVESLGKLEPTSAAWMQTRLQALCCYLDSVGMTHNDVSLNSIFVSPKFHTLLLIGGWWHAAPAGAKITHLPRRTVAYAPPSVLAAKKASMIIDTTMVRVLGRELLGDASGMALDKSIVPEPYLKFLRSPASNDPVADYRSWEKAREASFGARRFVELKFSKSDLKGLDHG